MARGPDPDIDPISVLELFVVSPEPAFVPSEIADELGVTTEGARHQMEKLVEQGYLRKKKPGQRTVMYWISEAGEQFYYEHAE